MRWQRTLAIGIALLAASAAAVGIGSASNRPAELLEGHTVFVAINNITGVEGHEGPAAAVAVLVREHNIPLVGRFPGVIWYNDQYLVNPSSVEPDSRTRYPCTGAVIAVERGQPDPRDGVALKPGRYVESYHITDPNDMSWDIDKWELTAIDGSVYLAWSVAIGNSQASSHIPDDGGASCDPAIDRGCPLPVEETACYQSADPTVPKASLERLDCRPPSCGTLRYNALLFFWLNDIENSGPPKNHTSPSSGDVPGCHGDDPEFGCPDGDDDREGNSHRVFDPLLVREPELGSADCDGNMTRKEDPHCHRTAGIDVYYGTAPIPPDREYVLYDGDGATEALTCGGLPAWLGTCLA